MCVCVCVAHSHIFMKYLVIQFFFISWKLYIYSLSSINYIYWKKMNEWMNEFNAQFIDQQYQITRKEVPNTHIHKRSNRKEMKWKWNWNWETTISIYIIFLLSFSILFIVHAHKNTLWFNNIYWNIFDDDIIKWKFLLDLTDNNNIYSMMMNKWNWNYLNP